MIDAQIVMIVLWENNQLALGQNSVKKLRRFSHLAPFSFTHRNHDFRRASVERIFQFIEGIVFQESNHILTFDFAGVGVIRIKQLLFDMQLFKLQSGKPPLFNHPITHFDHRANQPIGDAHGDDQCLSITAYWQISGFRESISTRICPPMDSPIANTLPPNRAWISSQILPAVSSMLVKSQSLPA